MYDELFLKRLFSAHSQKKYAKVILLDFQEKPQEIVEGRITSGSINVDGTSAVRRTCQLSMVTEKVDVSNYLWGLDTKFKLEIGLENNIDSRYPEIVWFK
jgi:hypothetical protein